MNLIKKKKTKFQKIPENLPIDLFLHENEDDPTTRRWWRSKLEPEETIAKRMKLNPWKRKMKETKLKKLTSNKLLTRLSILLAQIKAGNYWYKLRNEIRQILFILYQHNKVTKNIYSYLIKSLQSWKKI